MRTLSGKIVHSIIQDKEVFFFVSDENDLIQRHHSTGRFYELEELNIISANFIGGVFLDIGSNIGNHVIYVAKYLNPLRIICIEPNPAAIEIMDINLRLNGICEIVDRRYLGIGLAAHAGTATLRQPQTQNMGSVQLLPGQGDVRLAVADDLLHTETPSFIKIDVEGMEIDVLRGLERLIDRCDPTMFIEVDNRNRRAFDDWRENHRYSIGATYRRYAQNENFLLVPNGTTPGATPL